MCERELETEQNCNILTSPLLWPSAFLSRSPGLLNRRPGGAALCWVLAFSSTSCLQTLRSPNSIGVPRAPSAWCWLSLPHLVTNSPISKLTDFLSSPSYIIFQSPTQYLLITGHRNVSLPPSLDGMFDRHQAEITVIQFTGHSLPVHQSVTVPWDFNPVPYCQSSSPAPMEYATSASLEWHVWPGRRSIYNNIIQILFHTNAIK